MNYSKEPLRKGELVIVFDPQHPDLKPEPRVVSWVGGEKSVPRNALKLKGDTFALWMTNGGRFGTHHRYSERLIREADWGRWQEILKSEAVEQAYEAICIRRSDAVRRLNAINDTDPERMRVAIYQELTKLAMEFQS